MSLSSTFFLSWKWIRSVRTSRASPKNVCRKKPLLNSNTIQINKKIIIKYHKFVHRVCHHGVLCYNTFLFYSGSLCWVFGFMFLSLRHVTCVCAFHLNIFLESQIEKSFFGMFVRLFISNVSIFVFGCTHFCKSIFGLFVINVVITELTNRITKQEQKRKSNSYLSEFNEVFMVYFGYRSYATII